MIPRIMVMMVCCTRVIGCANASRIFRAPTLSSTFWKTLGVCREIRHKAYSKASTVNPICAICTHIHANKFQDGHYAACVNRWKNTRNYKYLCTTILKSTNIKNEMGENEIITDWKCCDFCSIKRCMTEKIPEKTASFICCKFLHQHISEQQWQRNTARDLTAIQWHI